jgi:hypothetical protein
MNTMQPLVPFGARLAVLATGVAIAAAGWLAAGHESRHAVHAQAVAMDALPVQVTLQRVEIVAKRRLPAEPALAAANNPHNEL